MPPTVAAVTMAFDEPLFVPIWCRHYQRQVGADHCYIVDHGSTERLQTTPGINTVRIPRSPHDDPKRARFVARFVAGLLEYYDWVIHTDIDELVLADPALYQNLPAYCTSVSSTAVTAIGFDIQHVPSLEADFDPARSVGSQRSWARFSSAMCKPVLTRQPITWAPGFHSSDAPMRFDSLYLFHLHWADRAIGLQRLRKTREMPWAPDAGGLHQRMADASWTTIFDAMSRFPRLSRVEFGGGLPPLAEWIGRVRDSASDGGPAAVDVHINAPELWSIPDRFRARL